MPEIELITIGKAARSIVDVIFVHDLGGSHPSTWQCDNDPANLWLKWLFEDVAGVSVYALNYPADNFRWAGSGADLVLPERARSIIDYLISSGIGERPVIFIAHSLGGLLVKEIFRLGCELNVQQWEPIAKNTVGILFIGTPNTGSKVAALAVMLKALGATKAAAQLVDNDPHLHDLNNWYQQNSRARGVSTRAYYETLPTNNVIIVDQTSANPGVEGCVPVPLDATHIDMCKPTSRRAPIYLGARSFVEQLVERIAADTDPARNDGFVILRGESDDFTSPVSPHDRLDLTEKLILAGRDHEVDRALRLKEQFAMTFTRHQLQSSANRFYVTVLADIESRFNAHVYPAIVNGSSIEQIADILREKVTVPIVQAHENSDNMINAGTVDRMIYYLTGLCYIRWHYDRPTV